MVLEGNLPNQIFNKIVIYNSFNRQAGNNYGRLTDMSDSYERKEED